MWLVGKKKERIKKWSGGVRGWWRKKGKKKGKKKINKVMIKTKSKNQNYVSNTIFFFKLWFQLWNKNCVPNKKFFTVLNSNED